MLFEGKKVILFHGVADLRKGGPGLLAIAGRVEEDTWYMFGNRRRNLIKCILRDKYGTWVSSRRLRQGLFQWIEKAAGSSLISADRAEQLSNGQKEKRSYKGR